MSNKAKIERVIYSEPATIVFWDDGTKTISKCDKRDEYDELTGFLLCVLKKTVPHKQWRKALKKYVYGNDPKYVKRDVVKNTDNYVVTYTNNEPIVITMDYDKGFDFYKTVINAILGV